MSTQADRYYMMDENGGPVPCADLLTWAQWFETADNRIAVDEIGPLTISTVFLGLPFPSLFDDSLLLYETMVIGAENLIEDIKRRFRDQCGQDTDLLALICGAPSIQRRYETVEQARAGHAEITAILKEAAAKVAAN